MGTLGAFALVFWEGELDTYRYILTEGIVRAMPGSGGSPLSTQKSKRATKSIIAGEPWGACLSSLFPLH
jgi:hypothetical protein